MAARPPPVRGRRRPRSLLLDALEPLAPHLTGPAQDAVRALSREARARMDALRMPNVAHVAWRAALIHAARDDDPRTLEWALDTSPELVDELVPCALPAHLMAPPGEPELSPLMAACATGALRSTRLLLARGASTSDVEHNTGMGVWKLPCARTASPRGARDLIMRIPKPCYAHRTACGNFHAHARSPAGGGTPCA